ncbi:hypothetical protein CLV30_114116 [Haloactinopolyspora alba]|uniref:Uncharacterized protein n=1 Tax=Haloactinopolyspora alba TaxID=648780 RepID=A0A2P8DVZ2_9ACTN|nr:hypothetical protein CLV30_114116 [Haloactinopolyspora alba]
MPLRVMPSPYVLPRAVHGHIISDEIRQLSDLPCLEDTKVAPDDVDVSLDSGFSRGRHAGTLSRRAA